MCTTNDSQCVIPEIVRATDRHSCHFRVFFALLPHLQPQKSKFWKKWKKYLKIISFYTYLPQMTIIWYMTWDMECDRLNFLPFWTIFCPFTPPPLPPSRYLLTTQKIKILKKWTIGDIIIIILIIWCMVPKIWSATDRIFSHVWPFFAQLTPNNPENQKFEKMEKTHGDIIILSVP